MIYTYIKFASQTYGEKARSLLKSYGINSTLKRNPNPNHKEGCNYALFVKGDIYNAFDMISDNHIENLGVESYRDAK